MHDRGAAPAKGAGAVGAAVGHAAPKAHQITHQRDTLIAQHITHYAENPKLHARALRQLGLNGQQLRAVHKNQVTSTRGIVKNPKGKLAGVVGFGSRFGKDLSDAAIYSPAGAYQAGKAAYHDVGDTVHGKPTLKRTAGIGKQLAEGVASDVRHPLRHPGNLALDLSAGVGAAEGIASRVAARSLRRPLTGTIEHREGDLVVKTPASKRAGVAALQRRAAARGGAAAVGKALTQERRITEAVERSPMEALAHRSRKLTTPQQTALRVVNEGKSIPERIKFHERMQKESSALGPGKVRHRQKALLLKAAGRYVVHDEKGVPSLKPIASAAGRHERGALRRLHEAQANIEQVATEREHRLARLGDLGEGRIEARLHGPGRVVQGATFERTPARKGRVEQVREYPGRSKTVTRPRSAQEAKARLASLDKEYDKIIGRVADAVNPHDNPQAVQLKRNYINSRVGKGKHVGTKRQPTVSAESRSLAESKLDEIAEKNPNNATVRRYIAIRDERAQLQETLNEQALPGESGLSAIRRQHPKTEIHAHETGDAITLSMIRTPEAERGKGLARAAMRDLIEYADRHGKTVALTPEPVGGGLTKAQLAKWYKGLGFRTNAGSRKDFRFRETMVREPRGTKKAPASLGEVTETIPGKSRRVHLREQRAQRAGARLVGAEDFREGKARIPYTAETPAKSLGSHAGFRGGVPRKPGSVTHEFTGGLLKSGNFRDDTARLVAESGLEAQRYTALHRLRDRVIAAAEHAPDDRHTLAVRLDSLKRKPFPPQVKAAMRKREDGVVLSNEERQTLADAHETARDEIFPKIDPADYAEHKDVVWVDPKVLDGLDRQQPRLENAIGRKPVAAIDAVNNVQKMAVLYLKPAYAVPNIAGNAALNLAQQGPHAMVNWWRSNSRRLDKKIGTDATAVIDSVMGEGVAGSISSDAGLGQKAVQAAAGAWSKVVDRVFRRAAFLHEARRLGYKSPQQLRRLLMDDAHRDQLIEAAQRAKDAIIDYDHLGPREREIVRRVIFFFPWVKGSTRYAGHFLVEHPIQSAVVGNLGEYGKQHTGLGPTPSYLEGSFKVGHNKLVNPAAAAIFQTPAQVFQALEGLTHGNVTEAARASNFATPALQLALSELARQDSFGNPIPATAGGLDIAKQTLVDSTPQATLIRRLTEKDNSNRLFPLSPKESLAQFGIGGVAPRTYNPTVLHAQAKKEQRSLLSPKQRVVSDYRATRDQLRTIFKAHGEPGIPRNVAARLNLRAERAFARTKAAGGHKLDTKTAFGADVDLIVRHGWMTRGEAAEAKRWAHGASKRDLSSASRYLTTHYFDSDGLLSESLKYLRDNGYPDVSLPSLP